MEYHTVSNAATQPDQDVVSTVSEEHNPASCFLGKAILVIATFIFGCAVVLLIVKTTGLHHTTPPTSSSQSSLLVDTDVGADDIMALTLLRGAGIHIDAVTVVNGMSHVEAGYVVLLRLWNAIQLEPPPVTHVGSPEPMPGGHSFEPDWRSSSDSASGFTLPSSPEGAAVPEVKASAWLANFISKAATGSITILCLGPLTNIAEALQLVGAEPFLKALARLVIVGGSVRIPGNGTPNQVSEWNMWVDPVAAGLVLSSLAPKIELIPFDATQSATCGDEVSPPLSDSCSRILRQGVATVCGWDEARFYDPVGAAYLIDRSILTFANISIRVIGPPDPNQGQTLEDALIGQPIRVALSLDRSLLVKVFSSKQQHCPP